MKKILIVAEYMLCGGVEKSLLSLLHAMDREKYQITLMLLQKRGALLSQVPNWVKIVEVPIPKSERDDLLLGRTNALKKSIKEKQFIRAGLQAMRGIWVSTLSRSDEKKRAHYYRLSGRHFSQLEEHYDIAIDYMGYGLFNTYYVAEKVSADIKLSWVHFDPIIGMNDFRGFKKLLDQYQGLICVSQKTKQEVLKCYPEYEDKCHVFYNLVDRDALYRQSDLDVGFADSFANIRMLSIGRLDAPKGFDLALSAIGKLKQDGFLLRWYIIGEGAQREELEKLIEEQHLEDTVFLLGQQLNPYPYLRQCDLYFQPSRHEGYGIAVAEARVFDKPMVVTDFAGAKEQIKDGITGTITKCNPDDLYISVKQLISDKNLQMRYTETLQKERCSVQDQIKQLYQIFDQLSNDRAMECEI